MDITSRWVHRASNLMFTLRSDIEQRKKLLSLSFGVNEPLVSTKYLYLLQYFFNSTNLSLADPGGRGANDARARSNFFHFHAVFDKNLAK